jgi:hypothetical protein
MTCPKMTLTKRRILTGKMMDSQTTQFLKNLFRFRIYTKIYLTRYYKIQMCIISKRRKKKRRKNRNP